MNQSVNCLTWNPKVHCILAFLCLAAGEVFAEPRTPDNLVWHRSIAGQFTVLALNKDQGEFVSQNAAKVKEWSLRRWGLPDLNMKSECRLLCVYNTELLKQLFGLDSTKVEWRDKERLIVGWLLLNGSPVATLPEPIMAVSLIELERQSGRQVDFWAKRGMIKLSNVPVGVRTEIVALNDYINTVKRVYFAQTIFSVDENRWSAMSATDKRLFDVQCMVLCLMLRKEYGQDRFNRLIFRPVSEAELNATYRFSSFSEFNKAYVIYMKKLCDDVARGQTPDSYLDIKPER